MVEAGGKFVRRASGPRSQTPSRSVDPVQIDVQYLGSRIPDYVDALLCTGTSPKPTQTRLHDLPFFHLTGLYNLKHYSTLLLTPI